MVPSTALEAYVRELQASLRMTGLKCGIRPVPKTGERVGRLWAPMSLFKARQTLAARAVSPRDEGEGQVLNVATDHDFCLDGGPFNLGGF
jgi:hypothetical protein